MIVDTRSSLSKRVLLDFGIEYNDIENNIYCEFSGCVVPNNIVISLYYFRTYSIYLLSLLLYNYYYYHSLFIIVVANDIIYIHSMYNVCICARICIHTLYVQYIQQRGYFISFRFFSYALSSVHELYRYNMHI